MTAERGRQHLVAGVDDLETDLEICAVNGIGDLQPERERIARPRFRIV
jgi:hypothetical protein